MFECLKNYTQKNYVLRNELETLTGGVLTAYTFRSPVFKDDAPTAIKIASRVAYRLDDVIDWLERHTEKEQNQSSTAT